MTRRDTTPAVSVMYWHNTCRIDKKTYLRADEFHVSTSWISIAPQVVTHLTVPIIFSTLIAYSSYNFYGAAIFIKAIYSQKSQCTAFLGRNFSKFENFDRFWLCPPKKWVNPNNIITNAH